MWLHFKNDKECKYIRWKSAKNLLIIRSKEREELMSCVVLTSKLAWIKNLISNAFILSDWSFITYLSLSCVCNGLIFMFQESLFFLGTDPISLDYKNILLVCWGWIFFFGEGGAKGLVYTQSIHIPHTHTHTNVFPLSSPQQVPCCPAGCMPIWDQKAVGHGSTAGICWARRGGEREGCRDRERERERKQVVKWDKEQREEMSEMES